MKFYYDIVCPYAYLASTRIEALAARAGQTLDWRPILLGGVFKSIRPEAAQEPAAMPAEKVRLNFLDMNRYARIYGVPLKLHPEHPRRSVSAMRLLHTVEGADRVHLTHILYRYYFVENRDISDKQVLAAAAAELGRPELAARIDDAETKDALRRSTDEAVADGVFGVPSFVVGDRLYWGQDRMHLFLPDQVPEEVAEAIPTAGAAPREVSFFFDFSSPYSYLGATQIERVAAASGGRVRVRWRPFLLGALFKQIGTPVVPLEHQSTAKQNWTRLDLADWAAHWKVEFKWPSRFPIRTVTALRMVLGANVDDRPALTQRLYRAFWVEDRDLNDPKVLAEVAGDATLVERALTDPALKQALIDATAEARAAGVCGAPSFLVGDELFWGQDRLALVARALVS